MDYGQTSSDQTTDLNSDFELDNFNLNTNEWGISTPEQSRRTLGSSAINHASETTIETAAPTRADDDLAPRSSDSASVSYEAPARQNSYENTPALGQITPNFPPGYQPPLETSTSSRTTTIAHSNLSEIAQKAHGSQGLSLSDAKDIDSAIADLGRSSDIDTFYEQIRADADSLAYSDNLAHSKSPADTKHSGANTNSNTPINPTEGKR